jgi:hypothetical protein
MAILTQSGRAAMAAAIANEAIHLAWGTGDPEWDTEPALETATAVALFNEIGRRKATLVQFVVEDEDGAITTTDVDDPSLQNSFSPSPENAPTNHLYLLFNFDFGDAPASTIRETGVFLGTETDPELPAGQRYFTPEEIVKPGILLAIEHLAAFNRSPSVRQTFELIITL